MSSRRRQPTDPLNRKTDPAIQSEWDKATYGEIAAVDAGMQTVYPTSIYEIFPDPKQPRRLLPGVLRYDRPPEDVLADWWAMAEDEARRTIPLVDLLTGEETGRSQDSVDHDPGHIEASFMKLVDLAATIRRDGGLINPVTIYRSGTVYQLETGERRWLAHHLLSFALVEERWQKISAREVTAPSIWRQAHENTARDDLNAISLARQLALLVMDIYQEKGVAFEPYEVFGHDRHFYAQVADGFEFPVAYGDRERIIAAMGKSNVSQVNQYRALLRLPDWMWDEADAENEGEKKLREKMQDMREVERLMPAPIPEQSPESITQVRDHSSVQAQEPISGQAEVIADVEVIARPALSQFTIDLLDWIYNHTAPALNERETWFTASAAGVAPEKLNTLIEQQLLEGKRPVLNLDRSAAFYRIAPGACVALGREIIRFDFDTTPTHLPPGADRQGFKGDLTPPISEGKARSGTVQQSGNPPRRNPHKLLTADDNRFYDTLRGITDFSVETSSPAARAFMLETIDKVRNALDRLEEQVRNNA